MESPIRLDWPGSEPQRQQRETGSDVNMRSLNTTIISKIDSGALRTSFIGNRGLWTTLIDLLDRCRSRKGAASRRRDNGRSERMLSSNSNVKSKPPRQLPAQGPKESSTTGHDTRVEFEAIFTRMSTSRERRSKGRCRDQASLESSWKERSSE